MGLETRSGLYQHNQGGIKLVRRLLRCRRFQFVRKHREINTGASKGRGSGCSLTGPGEPGRAGPVPCLRARGDDDRRGGPPWYRLSKGVRAVPRGVHVG